ncbi:MAG: glucans biosynthesis glucosyltransferase MdoH [Hyphomonadaceae bacterium]|nr:glucans biosynthesis glucosyltransferase MdoH [Hyphomonadaceae bacterium]
MDARVKLDAPLLVIRPVRPETPPEAPLAMPQQRISAERVRLHGETDGRWRLGTLLAAALGVTALATLHAWSMLNADGVSLLEWLGLVLLAANLAWISLAAATAVAGAAILASREPGQPTSLKALDTTSLTAIVFPIRNEDTSSVTAGAQAIYDALARAGAANAFEIFFLSDTTDPELAHDEADAIQRLRAARPDAAIFYRRRTLNHGRKAGNVSDFVRRWGGRYDYMAVFDADSLMSAEALIELVQRMDDRLRTALIQTVPSIVNAQTMMARSQQFAMRAYGQIFGTGLAWWSGGAGNFWGHNAIIRVAAFAANAGLPDLPGRGPLGGHIMSHDFIEAALLRRAGWRVEIAPEIDGSYEESPPTLDDLAARDRRWAQGNLQHLKLVGARGFDAVSRAHILAGVMGYVSALLWFSLIMVSAVLAWIGTPGAPRGEGGGIDISLLLLTTLIVLSPKWLALILWAMGRLPGWEHQRGFVGGLIAEAAVSAATAPIMMISQAQAVIAPFLGRDAGWRPQARVAVSGASTGSRFKPQVFVGLGLCATMLVSAGFAAWTLPVAVSLVFARPIAAGLAYTPRRRSWLWRILATPEDLKPPAVVTAARRATTRFTWEASTQPIRIAPALAPISLATQRVEKAHKLSV